MTDVEQKVREIALDAMKGGVATFIGEYNPEPFARRIMDLIREERAQERVAAVNEAMEVVHGSATRRG